MIKAMADKGGVIHINYFTNYIDQDVVDAQRQRRPQFAKIRAEIEQKYPGPENEEKRAQELQAARRKMPPLPTVSWEKIIEHIDHVVQIAGVDHVGLGSDFDGAVMPEGMEDVTHLGKITEALLRKGYSESDIKKILGGNLLRLMEEVERVAAKGAS